VTVSSTFNRQPVYDKEVIEHIEDVDFGSTSIACRRQSVNSLTGSERGHLRIVTVE
jgi:hypothetical protein